MIKYLFIIDFLENIHLELPLFKSDQYSSVVNKIKTKMVSQTRTSDGYVQKIMHQGKKLYLFAKANEDNITVCVITEENYGVKEKVWEVIRKIFAELHDVDIDRDDIAKKRPVIQNIVAPYLETDIVIKVKTLTDKATKQVSKMQKTAEKNAQLLLESLEVVEETEQVAIEMEAGTQQLKNYYWWENKKMLVMVVGACALVLIFICMYIRSIMIMV